MELQEFIDKVVKDAKMFERWWLIHQKGEDAANFPMQMNYADWLEQMEFFSADMDK